MAQNLGFVPLYEAADRLTEDLRPEGKGAALEEVNDAFAVVNEAYEKNYKDGRAVYKKKNRRIKKEDGKMKLVIIEPLGVEKERLLSMAEEALKGRAEIIYYDTRATDTQELIRRGQDADVIVVSNLPLNGEVIRGCRNLEAFIRGIYRGRPH